MEWEPVLFFEELNHANRDLWWPTEGWHVQIHQLLFMCVLKLCTLSLEIHLHFWWGVISCAHSHATARSWPTTTALRELSSCEWHWVRLLGTAEAWAPGSSAALCHEFQTIHSQLECVCTIWGDVFFRWVVMCCWVGFLPYLGITALRQWYFCHCAESWIILKVFDCGGC